MTKNRRKAAGFTLSELLIALAILGLIAAFTIPKVLQAQEENKKKAIFKESISMLAVLTETGIRTGGLTPTTRTTYTLDHINAIKVCSTNAATEGCWDEAVQGSFGGEEDYPGVILANGANVVGLNDCCDSGGGFWSDGVVIDWNGVDGPNTPGDDQIRIIQCFGTATCTNIGGAGPKNPGSIGPATFDGAPAVTLYEGIFQ